MEEVWESKWRSFQRSKPKKSKQLKENKSPKQPLDETSLLRELTDGEYEKVSDIVTNVDVDDLSFDDIFKGRKRIVVPFTPGPTGTLGQMIEFFDLNGYVINWVEGTAEKEVATQKGTQVRKTKVGKLLNNLFNMYKKYEDSADLFNSFIAKSGAMKRQRGTQAWNADVGYDETDEKFPPSPEELQLRVDAEKAKAMVDRTKEQKDKLFPSEYNMDQHVAAGFLKHWTEKGNYYRENPGAVKGEEGKYSLVVTRAPIDVLRMSDFDDIHSCHSPPSRPSTAGGGYYQCAVAEANGHGPIAYVVSNSDIPPEFDWENEEVFEDDHRGVEGPTPISRVRIRKFVNDEDGYELAVPETRNYGAQFPNLNGTVTDFLRKAQPNIPTPNEVGEFTRYGGSYADHTDGDLFNNLFGVDFFEGDTDNNDDDEGYDGDFDEEEVDVEAEYNDECERLDHRHNDSFNHAWASYEVEPMDGDSEAYVSMNGGLTISFDEEEFINPFPVGWQERSKVTSAIEGVINASIGEIDIQEYDGKIDIIIEAYREDVEPNPAGYREFLTYNVKELDDEYEQIFLNVRKLFEELGFLGENEYSRLHTKIASLEHYGDMFQHFDANNDDSDTSIEIDLKAPSLIPLDVSVLVDEDHIARIQKQRDSGDEFSVISKGVLKKTMEILGTDSFRHSYWSGIVRMIEEAASQMELPGTQGDAESEADIRMPFEDLEVSVRHGSVRKTEGQPWKVELDVKMRLEGVAENEDLVIALRLIKFIDDNFQKVILFTNKVFQDIYESHFKGWVKLDSSLSEVQVTENLIREALAEVNSSPRKKLSISIG